MEVKSIIVDTSKLRDVCEPISSLEEEEEIITLLQESLNMSAEFGRPGIGLAAPQIGINKRAAVIRVDKNNTIDLINSKILLFYNKTIQVEGCLSLPGKICKVQRFADILLENNSFKFGPRKFAAYGLSSICIQHEMDHWDGVLMTDIEIKEEKNIGPNMDCICGSKIKYKKCCGKKEKNG